MRDEINTRTIRLLLGAFEVRIPLREPIRSEEIFLSRDIVNEVFESAHDEFMGRKTLFNRPIRPHTLITNVKHSSVVFDVLYQIIANIPWAELTENTEWLIKQGLHYLKEIGSVAAGLYVMKDIGNWIRERLRKKQVPLEKNIVSVDIKSTIEINENLLDNKEKIIELRKRLYHDDKPSSIATVVSNREAVNWVFKLAEPKNVEEKHHLGGQIIINDLNLHVNGIDALNKLKIGDLFIFNNYSALGMQFNYDPATVYQSASLENPDVEIQSLVMSAYETEDEKRIIRGRPIDSNDLEDA